jgi:tetratricopeptide (TPR) repeat protein
MSSNPNQQVTRHLRRSPLLLVAALLLGLVGTTGCEEISARRAVQEGNKQYEKGEFEKAAQLYEEALQKAPHLDTAHFNAGLTYKKMFQPGKEDPKQPGKPDLENLSFAKKAADHFLAYLSVHPKERDIITLLTDVWTKAEDYDSALAYWQRELDKEPKNTEIIGIMAGINRQAGRFDKAMEWYLRQVELETDPQAKAGAYKAIGSLMVSRLKNRTHEVLAYERLEIADTGVGILQKAAALAPEDADVQTALGFLYGERALAQSTTWAQITEVAAARHHYKKWAELNKKAQQQAADPNQAPGAAPDKKPDGADGAGAAAGGDKKEG